MNKQIITKVKSIIVFALVVLLSACKKDEDKSATGKKLTGTWQSTSLNARENSGGTLVKDSVVQVLAPEDYVFIFKEDQTFEVITRIDTPLHFIQPYAGKYSYDDTAIYFMQQVDGVMEINGGYYYLNDDQLGLVIMGNIERLSETKDIILNLKKKQ